VGGGAEEETSPATGLRGLGNRRKAGPRGVLYL